MFISANQQGQDKGWSWGCDRPWWFGVFPGVGFIWANQDPWAMGAGDDTAQGWLLDAVILYPPPRLGMCISWGFLLSKGTLLK